MYNSNSVGKFVNDTMREYEMRRQEAADRDYEVLSLLSNSTEELHRIIDLMKIEILYREITGKSWVLTSPAARRAVRSHD